jgi:hypothetical protein
MSYRTTTLSLTLSTILLLAPVCAGLVAPSGLSMSADISLTSVQRSSIAAKEDVRFRTLPFEFGHSTAEHTGRPILLPPLA